MQTAIQRAISEALVLYGRLPYHPGKWRVVDLVCARLGLHANPPTEAVIRRSGMWFHVNPRYYIDRTLYFLGSWEGGYTRAIQRILEPGMVVLDVGANIGWYTLMCAHAVGPTGRVHAFEPVPEEVDRLRRNVRLNALSQVSVHEVAVSDAVGVTCIGETRDAGATWVGEGDREVRTTTLDAFVDRQRLSRVDFVKMDIEGAEVLALRGAQRLLRELRPRLMVEVEPKPLSRFGFRPGDVLDALRRADYSLHCLAGSRFREYTDGPLSRNIFAFPRPG